MTLKKLCQTLILVLFGIWFSSQGAFSIGASPFPQDIQQPDHSIITIKMHGDEWFNWITTTDGFRIMKGSSGLFEYAAQLKSGQIVPSGTKASNPDQRSEQERTFLSNTPKNLGISLNTLLQQREKRLNQQLKSSNMKTRFPAQGEAHLLVILVNFSDTQPSYSQPAFDRFMNEPDYNGTGSFRDYYQEVSGNQLTVISTVTQWITVPSTRQYYAPEEKWHELALDAIKGANEAGVDFSLFDNDNDGLVEGVAIIHQGAGQEVTGDENDIWSHSHNLASSGVATAERTFDNKVVDQYTIQPEWQNGSGNMNTIGVICHEFGHNLGLPDFYDTLNGSFDGTGNWDLMASGAYNGSPIGSSPAHHNPFSKEELGWINVTVIDNPGSMTLDPIISSRQALRVNAPNNNDYLLLENRQKTGFDQFIPGEGMVVYHVDSTWLVRHRLSNTINTESHQGLYPIVAEGLTNSASCPFPGTMDIPELTDYSTPSTHTWEGTPFNRSLTNIRQENSTVSFDYMSLQDGSPLSILAHPESQNKISISWEPAENNFPILLAWSPDGEFGHPIDKHLYQIGETISGGGEVLYVGNDSEPFTHDELMPSTHYYYSIWSNKGDIYSQNIKVATRTHASPVEHFPWFEGFESGLSNWRQESVSGDNQWLLTQQGSQGLPPTAYEGLSFVTLKVSGWTKPVTRLISPLLNLSADTTYFMDFRHTQPHWENDQDFLRVSIRTQQGNWEELVFFQNDLPGWAHQRVKLPYSQPVQIAFEGTSNYGYGIALDSIMIYPATECLTPPQTPGSGITASNITEDALTLSWQRGDGDSVLVVARKGSPVFDLPINGMSYTASNSFATGDSIGPDSFVIYNGSGNQVNITNLQHTSNYHFSFFEYYAERLCYQYLPATATITTRPKLTPITLQVTDTQGNPLTNALVEIDGTDQLTNEQGITSFPLDYSTIYQTYRVSKQGFVPIAGRFMTDKAQQITVQLPTFDPISPSWIKTSFQDQDLSLNWNPVINDDFESDEAFSLTPRGWTLVDNDGSMTFGLKQVAFPNETSAMAFMVFDAYDEEILQLEYDISAWSGSKILACFASINGPNDDWIISPMFEPNENDFFSFMGRSLTDTYGPELFNVKIKREGESEWTALAEVEEAPINWARFQYALSDFSGTRVQVAIQCVSDDVLALLLDDLRVGNALGTLPLSGSPAPSRQQIPFQKELPQPSAYAKGSRSSRKVPTAAPALSGNMVYQLFKDDLPLTNITGFNNTNYSDIAIDCSEHQYSIRSYYPINEVASIFTYSSLIKPCVTIIFTINNSNEEPVSGAQVTFNNQTKFSDALGQVVFDDIRPGTEKAYTIEMTGYAPSQGSLDTYEDQNLSIVLKIATAIASPSPNLQHIRMLPNPVKAITHIQGLPKTNSQLKIFDMTGRQVISRKINKSPSLIMDLSPLSPGIYLLVVTSQQEKRFLKFVKTE